MRSHRENVPKTLVTYRIPGNLMNFAVHLAIQHLAKACDRAADDVIAKQEDELAYWLATENFGQQVRRLCLMFSAAAKHTLRRREGQ